MSSMTNNNNNDGVKKLCNGSKEYLAAMEQSGKSVTTGTDN